MAGRMEERPKEGPVEDKELQHSKVLGEGGKWQRSREKRRELRERQRGRG